MRLRTRTTVGLVAAIAALTMVVAPVGSAAAYVFPDNSNAENREAGLPHVNELSTGPGTVTLEFVNETNSLAFFEYRIDGVTVGETPHPVVHDDVIHPGVGVDCRTSKNPNKPCASSPVVRILSAESTVEVRLALGGERDWDFDWTEFEVGPPSEDPTTKADCKKGGWESFGFANQGQCIRFVNTGKDSR